MAEGFAMTKREQIARKIAAYVYGHDNYDLLEPCNKERALKCADETMKVLDSMPDNCDH